MKKPEASDTPSEIALWRRRMAAETGGLARLTRVAAMFRGLRAMLSLKFDDPIELLRQIHGAGISEADYQAMAAMNRERSSKQPNAA